MRKILLFLGLACMLVLAGCQDGGQEEGPQPEDPFIGGTTGVSMYFLEGLPPPQIQDNNQSPFSIGVVLENQGEADIGADTANPYVRMTLEGINPQVWGLPDDTTQIFNQTLRGARKNFDGTILPGEVTTITYENMSYGANVRGNTPYTVRAELCYDYTTIATTQVCIKDDVLEHLQDDSLCSLSGEKNPRNSGAPVHVTSLVQNPMAQNKIQVAFTVEHVGTGQVYGRSPNEACSPAQSNMNKNKVQVTVDPLADNRWTVRCSRFGGTNSDTITLFQGAPQKITCTLERTGDSQGRIFQDVLEITLRYRYGQFIETPILVQDVSNEPGADA